MTYALSYCEREDATTVGEKYHSFFKWIMRIVQLLKQGHSVLIYKPESEVKE